MNIGEIIKQKRLEKNMSQADLAKLIYVKRQTISKYENGLREPDLNTFFKICNILDIDINLLKNKKEKNKINKDKILILIEIGIMIFTFLSILILPTLNPEIIPCHYDINFNPDRYGSYLELYIFFIVLFPEIILFLVFNLAVKDNINSLIYHIPIIILDIFLLILSLFFILLNIKYTTLIIIRISLILLFILTLILSIFMNPFINKKPNIYFGYRTYNSINYPDIWFKGNLLASIIGILFSLIIIIVLIYVSNLKFLYALFSLFLYIPLIIFEYKINKKRLAKK